MVFFFVSEHLRGFDLYITSDDPDQMRDSDLVYSDNIKQSEYTSRRGIYVIPIHHRGQFVHIQLPKSRAHLVLCEVEVYEGKILWECFSGFYR